MENRKRMKIGVIISQADPETAWNAFRFANFSLGKQHAVKAFFIGKGVECEDIGNPQFDVREQMEKFSGSGGQIFACGSCLKLRQKEKSIVLPMSTMQDLMDIVEESDRVLSF